MENSNYITQIEALKKMLDTLPPANEEQREKLWKKFRLEWNYNSNHIEGNTLTYGQTELLLIFDKATGEKDLREYEEMKAHDLAIKMVVEEAKDKERPLTENFIRLLNEKILVRPFWKEAETADGQKTRREIQIGQYKSMPNSVRLSNGEIFHYASPQETPAMMHDLVAWYNGEKELHPVILAAVFHYRFVRIHPFDDGNGRGARLVMNYILMKHGFPPVIIKSDDKANYLLALNKADIGDLSAFTDYIASQMIWSLDISIRAAKGESIDELQDWKKELELLKRNLPKDEGVSIKQENIKFLAINVLKPLFNRASNELNKFNELFEMERHAFVCRLGDTSVMSGKTFDELFYLLGKGNDSVQMELFWVNFNKKRTNKFDVFSLVQCIFYDSGYEIVYPLTKSSKIIKLYGETLIAEEQDQIIAAMAKQVLEEIESKTKTK